MNNQPNNPYPERKIAVPKRRLNRTTSSNSLGNVGNTNMSDAGGFGFPTASQQQQQQQPQQQAFGSGFGGNLSNSNPTPMSGFGQEAALSPAFGTNNERTPGSFNQSFGQQSGSFSSAFGSSNNENSNQVTPFGFNTSTSATNTAFNFSANSNNTSSGANPFAGFTFGTPVAPVTAAKPPLFGGGMDTSGPPAFTFGQQGSTENPFAGIKTSQSVEPSSHDSRKRRYSVDMEDVTESEEQSNKKTVQFSNSSSSGSSAPGFSFGSFTAKTTIEDSGKRDIEVPFSIPASNATTAPKAPAATPAITFSSSFNTEKADNEKKDTMSTSKPFGALPASSSASPFTFGSTATLDNQEKDSNLAATSKPFKFQTPTSFTSASGSENTEKKDKPFTFASPVPLTSDSQSKTSPFTFGSAITKKDDENLDEKNKTSHNAEHTEGIEQPEISISAEDDNNGNDLDKEDNTSKDDGKGAEKLVNEPNAAKESTNEPTGSENTEKKDKPFTFASPAPLTSDSQSKTLPFTFGSVVTKKNDENKALENTEHTEQPEISISAEDDNSGDSLDKEDKTSKDNVKEAEKVVNESDTAKEKTDKPVTFPSLSSAKPLGSSDRDQDVSESSKSPFAFTAPSSASSLFSGQKTATPAFSFGAPKPSKPTVEDAPEDDDKTSSAPSSVPAVSSSTSAFSFGSGAKTASPAPSFSFANASGPPAAVSSTPAFSFGSTSVAPSSTTAAVSSTPAFSFGSASVAPSSTTAAVSSTPAFSFGSASVAPSSATTVVSSTPAFSFGSNAKTTTPTPTFSFGSVSGAPSSTSVVSSTAPTFSSESVSEPPSSTPVVSSSAPTFSFGSTSAKSPSTPAVSSSAPAVSLEKNTDATSSASTFSFGSASKPPSSTPAVSSSAPTNSFGSNANATSSASTFSFGSLSAEKESKKTEPATITTEAKDGDKPSGMFSFSMASTTNTSKSISTDGTTNKKEVMPAISKPNTSVLTLKPTTNYLSGTPNVPTTLKTDVMEPSQVTFTTRFWELPEMARSELAELQSFIDQQGKKYSRIEEQINSSFIYKLNDIQTKTNNLSIDADILSKQLETQANDIYGLIDKNAQQRTNIEAMNHVLKPENKNWRTLGAAENWQYFTDNINNMNHRIQDYSQTVQAIGDAIKTAEVENTVTPERLSEVLVGQKRMFLSLSGKVAGLHEEVERIKQKKRKLF